jgi:hypothetical protein
MLNPTGKFARSWALFTSTLQVMRGHRKLLLFPIITAACSVVIAIFFLAPAVLYPSGHGLTESGHWLALAGRFGLDVQADNQSRFHPGALFYGYAAAIYLVSMFLATFANVAFYHQIMQALSGQPVSIRAGIRFAGTRLQSILVWSLFAGLVGLIIKSLEERFGLIGQWVMKFVGVVWSVASIFAIPVIIREETTNPVTLLRNSAATLRKTWGESLIGYAGITVGSWIVALGSLAFLAIAVVGSILLHVPLLILPAVLLWLAAICIYGYVIGVASHIYRCALYVYASEGVVPAPYSADMMNMAWKVKKS